MDRDKSPSTRNSVLDWRVKHIEDRGFPRHGFVEAR